MKRSPKARLLSYIRRHCRGRAKGMKLADIRYYLPTWLGDRECRALIAELVADGHPIGTSPQHGVFWAIDPEDYLEDGQSARAALTIIRRRKKFTSNCVAAGVFTAKGRRS